MTLQTQSDSNLSFRQAAAHACKRAWSVTRAVLTHPMFWFSVGNNLLTWGEAMRGGPEISILGTVAIVGTIIYSELSNAKTDLKKAMPYGTLATVNFVTAAMIMYGNEAAKDIWGAAASAACLAVWGVGHVHRARLFPRGLAPGHIGENPLFWTGIADIFASIKTALLHGAAFFAATPASAAGAIMSVFPEGPKIDVKTKWDFVRKHVTPSRMLAASYVVQASLLAPHGPYYFMGATLAWVTGFIPFDGKRYNREQNATLCSDFRKAFPRKPALQTLGLAS